MTSPDDRHGLWVLQETVDFLGTASRYEGEPPEAVRDAILDGLDDALELADEEIHPNFPPRAEAVAPHLTDAIAEVRRWSGTNDEYRSPRLRDAAEAPDWDDIDRPDSLDAYLAQFGGELDTMALLQDLYHHEEMSVPWSAYMLPAPPAGMEAKTVMDTYRANKDEMSRQQLEELRCRIGDELNRRESAARREGSDDE